MNIYSLRMAYKSVTVNHPFDRAYLVEHGNHAVFKQLFRYAIVLPVSEIMRKAIADALASATLTYKPFLRDDDAIFPGQRKDVTWATNVFMKKEWVLALPLLPKDARAQTPRYLVAEKLYSFSKKDAKGRRTATINPTVTHAFSDLAYLQTPKKQIRPVCIACPRFIAHQGGECSLGEKICIETLMLGPRYEAPARDTTITPAMINDPAVQEVLAPHGLQDDKPDSV